MRRLAAWQARRTVSLLGGKIDPRSRLQLGHGYPVVQHGYTPVREDLPNVTWRQFMPYADVVATMTDANIVICHAGIGTIMTALRAIVIPRLQQRREHVDDHQRDIAMRLEERGLIICLKSGQPVSLLNTLRVTPVGEDAVGVGEEFRATVARAVDETTTKRHPRLIRRALGL